MHYCAEKWKKRNSLQRLREDAYRVNTLVEREKIGYALQEKWEKQSRFLNF